MVGAGLRHSDVTRQYWIADGLKLRKIFDQKIDSMDNVEDGREPTVKSGKLALTGSFPNASSSANHGKRFATRNSGDTSCDGNEQTSTTIFVYDGKTYVRRKNDDPVSGQITVERPFEQLAEVRLGHGTWIVGVASVMNGNIDQPVQVLAVDTHILE